MQAPFKIPKRVKVTDEAKKALSEYKEKNKLGDPAKTLENLKNAKKAMFDILNELGDSSSTKVVSTQTLLSLYIEKRDFASDTKESEKGVLFKIPTDLRKLGQNDKKHFKDMDWNADYEKWQIFFFYRLVTKRLIQALLKKNYADGSIDARWKSAAMKVVDLKKKLWAETLEIKIRRMSGQKKPAPTDWHPPMVFPSATGKGKKKPAPTDWHPPMVFPSATGEGKKKRRRGRGKKKEEGEPAGESRARSQSKGRPVNPPKD